MKRMRSISAAIAAVALLAQALPAMAQSSGYVQSCRNVGGRLVCGSSWSGGAAGGHAYERWSNGSPAVGGGTSADAYQFPQYLGGHNSWYGFGR